MTGKLLIIGQKCIDVYNRECQKHPVIGCLLISAMGFVYAYYIYIQLTTEVWQYYGKIFSSLVFIIWGFVFIIAAYSAYKHKEDKYN